jgi:hypothetical protein
VATHFELERDASGPVGDLYLEGHDLRRRGLGCRTGRSLFISRLVALLLTVQVKGFLMMELCEEI